MKTAIVIALFGIFATVGVAATGSLNGKVNRVEDKIDHRQERIENKIDKQTEDIKNLTVAIGRIEEALGK